MAYVGAIPETHRRVVTGNPTVCSIIIIPGDHEALALNVQELYLDSLRSFGIDPLTTISASWKMTGNRHCRGLGAWLGVWLDGMEITQFNHFQQVGGFDLNLSAPRLPTASNGSPCTSREWQRLRPAVERVRLFGDCTPGGGRMVRL